MMRSKMGWGLDAQPAQPPQLAASGRRVLRRIYGSQHRLRFSDSRTPAETAASPPVGTSSRADECGRPVQGRFAGAPHGRGLIMGRSMLRTRSAEDALVNRLVGAGTRKGTTWLSRAGDVMQRPPSWAAAAAEVDGRRGAPVSQETTAGTDRQGLGSEPSADSAGAQVAAVVGEGTR